MNIELGILLTLISGFIGVLGYLNKRDNKVANDSEWKGTVNAKLDLIIGIKKDVQHLENQVQNHEGRIIKLETNQDKKE